MNGNASKNSLAEMPAEKRNDHTRMNLKEKPNNIPDSVGENINVEKNTILRNKAKAKQRKPSSFGRRPLTAFSRVAVMLQMARGANVVEQKPRKSTLREVHRHQRVVTRNVQMARESKAYLKELDPDTL